MSRVEEVQLHNTGSKRLFREAREGMIADGWDVVSQDNAQCTLQRTRRTKPPARPTTSSKSKAGAKGKQKVDKSSNVESSTKE